MRRRRCRHSWVEMDRKFLRPVPPSKVNGLSEEAFRHLVFGVTRVELRCRECGDVEERLLAGDAR
jgi:hypothetical protein